MVNNVVSECSQHISGTVCRKDSFLYCCRKRTAYILLPQGRNHHNGLGKTSFKITGRQFWNCKWSNKGSTIYIALLDFIQGNDFDFCSQFFFAYGIYTRWKEMWTPHTELNQNSWRCKMCVFFITYMAFPYNVYYIIIERESLYIWKGEYRCILWKREKRKP